MNRDRYADMMTWILSLGGLGLIGVMVGVFTRSPSTTWVVAGVTISLVMAYLAVGILRGSFTQSRWLGIACAVGAVGGLATAVVAVAAPSLVGVVGGVLVALVAVCAVVLLVTSRRGPATS